MSDALTSQNHREVQARLFHLLEEKLRARDAKVADALHGIIEVLSANNQDGIAGALMQNGTLSDRVTKAIGAAKLTAEQKYELTNAITLLPQLARTATITAAQNQLKQEPEQQDFDRMVAQCKAQGWTASKIVAHLGRIAMENVFTAHPTYIGTLEYGEQLRKLEHAIVAGDDAATAQGIENLLKRQPVVADRFKVQDETVMMRHYMRNAYDSLPAVYDSIDAAMQRAGMSDYTPEDMKLDIAFRSWGSGGDKDGNVNVTFQALRDAIFTHREAIINAYGDNLNAMMAALPADARAPLQETYTTLRAQLDSLRIHADTPPSPHMPAAVASDLKQFVLAIYHDEKNPATARKAALDLYRRVQTFGMHLGTIEMRETADENQYVLNHIFTADVLAQVPNLDTRGRAYSQLSEAEKEQVLNHALEEMEPEELRKAGAVDRSKYGKLLEHALIDVPAEAKTRRYQYADSGRDKKDDPTSAPKSNNGIFFHTIERLRLAAQNPDMFKGQVLAEAKTPAEMKEMLFLLKLTGNDKNIRVIPLFEDPEVLAELASMKKPDGTTEKLGIMDRLHLDPHFFAHMVDVSLNEWDEKAKAGLRPDILHEHIEPGNTKSPTILQEISALPLHLHDSDPQKKGFHDACRLVERHLNAVVMAKSEQDAAESGVGRGAKPPMIRLQDVIHSQVQLAHSDNMRRGGIAARAGIYLAHDVVRQSANDLNLGAQLYEGGSHTDSFRMGVRSYRSLVNLYDNHHFMKATVQGMDLAQLFSNPATIEAFLEENIANAAMRTSEKAKGFAAMPARRQDEYRSRAIMTEVPLIQTVIDEVNTYQQRYFGSEKHPNIILGNIIAQVFDYQGNSQSGTLGSRSGARIDGTSKPKDFSRFINPVTDTRTIGYSETFQHGRMNPNFIGSGEIRRKLLDLVSDAKLDTIEHAPLFARELRAAGDDTAKLHKIYTDSPVLRDTLDRVAYAIATTDFEKVWDNAMHDYSSGTCKPRTLQLGIDDARALGTETIKARPDVARVAQLAADEAAHKQSAEAFLGWMEQEYRNGAELVLEAITGQKPYMTLPTRDLALQVRAALPMYREMMNQQDVIMEAADQIQRSLPKEVRTQAYGGVVNGLNKALHNARDMATLARPPFQSELLNQQIKQVAVEEPARAAAAGAGR